MIEPAPARWRELLDPALASRLGLVVLGIWLNAADGMVTATVMPSVARDLGGFLYFAWAVVGFQLGCILAAAGAGRLAERFGLRPALVGAALVYAAGCAASAAAPSIAVFLAGRFVQGAGAGWVVGLVYVAQTSLFPERLWTRIFGVGAGVWGVASLLGPLVGGVFAQIGHWRWVFSGFALQGGLFALAASVLLAGVAPVGSGGRAAPPWRTLAALTAAVAAIAAADISRHAFASLAWLAAGLGLLALAVRLNAHPGERLIPRQAADPRTRAGAGYAAIFLFSAASTVFSVYGAVLLQTLFRLSPLSAGYVVAMEAFGWTAAAFVVAGQPEPRHPPFIRAGGAGVLAGLAALALAFASGRLAAVIAAAALMGAGFGLCWSLMSQRIVMSLGAAERAIAASALPTLSMIGGAVGAAAAGAAANLLGLAHGFGPECAGRLAPYLFAVFVPVAAAGWAAAQRLASARAAWTTSSQGPAEPSSPIVGKQSGPRGED